MGEQAGVKRKNNKKDTEEMKLKRKPEEAHNVDQIKKIKSDYISDSTCNLKVHAHNDQNVDSTDNILVKKKKPYFRVKGAKTDELNVDVEEAQASSKFTISLPVGSSVSTPEMPMLKSSGKGPKIVIASKGKKNEVKQGEEHKKLSKRKRKHLKAGEAVPEDAIHESKGMGKALRYLKTWNEDRASWKFEKCRQIWLLHNAYDETKVSQDIFPILLNYIASVKGGMRQGTIDIAKQKLENGERWEKQSDEKGEEELEKEFGNKLSDVELGRARQIIELLS